MKLRLIEHKDYAAVTALLAQTMPWAPATTSQELEERRRYCPDGQGVVTDALGSIIGYGFINRTRPAHIQGSWYKDTGHGTGSTFAEKGNLAYIGSTVWSPKHPLAVRSLMNWYFGIGEKWGVAQVMGFSRIPSIEAYVAAQPNHAVRSADVHEHVLDKLDPLTRVYWKLGLEPGLPQPNYSPYDHASAGFGILMVRSIR